MVIELLQKGEDKYLVRYKVKWIWWYLGPDDEGWFWPDAADEMELEAAQEAIERLKVRFAEPQIVEHIEV